MHNPDTTAQPPVHARQRILVVDDDLNTRQFNAAALSRSGYDVDVAGDGASAWEALQLKKYDLLVTDNEMPKLNGIGLVKRIHEAGMILPIVMASGIFWEQPESAPEVEVEVEAVLFKPHGTEALLKVVKSILDVDKR